MAGLILGIGIWVGAVNADRKSFKTFMEKVERKIDRILERLPAPPVQSASPIQLTDFGREISTTGSAFESARKHAPNLIADADEKEEFEIFDLCFAYVENSFNSDSEFA